MINENRYSYITDLPSPSLTQKGTGETDLETRQRQATKGTKAF